MTTDEFLRMAGVLYEEALADLDDEDFEVDEAGHLRFIETLCFFVKIASACNGKVEVEPITPKHMHGGITATFLVFDISGEDIQRMCEALKNTSAVTIDGLSDGRIQISVTVPNVYRHK